MDRAPVFLAVFIMLNSKQIGISTELQCLAACGKLGIQVLIPYGDYARYDFVIDVNNKFYRVQCKTSSKRDEGVYEFSCRSTAANYSRAATRSYTEEEIDFYATMIEDECYLIPITECGVRSKTLRFVEPKTNNQAGVSMAIKYKLETQVAKLNEG